MKCKCGGKLIVTDSAADNSNVYRIRVCNKCHKRIGSIERTNVAYQSVQPKINAIKKGLIKV